MIRIVFAIICCIVVAVKASADSSDYIKYFDVDMQMEIPDIREYAKKLTSGNNIYDKGYISRFNMGNQFKKEFSRKIKQHGLDEGRIKSHYEDELIELLSWLPKEAYQYIGPLLHEIPGMSEKILNLPGIKETKNKFPEEIAEKYKAMENIEFLSPQFYFLLIPEIWQDPKISEDAPRPLRVKKPQIRTDIPDFLKEKIDIPVPQVEEKKKAVLAQTFQPETGRTLFPTLTSPLTGKDISAFIATIDKITEWGQENNNYNILQLIKAEMLLNAWEEEQGTALMQNGLKDFVNPCQRLVLKTRFAGLYTKFRALIAEDGFSPEEWAYTCDKTFKAFRAADADVGTAYAVQAHRRGYYKPILEKMPEKWRNIMYANEAAIIRLYTAKKEDVLAVKPFVEDITRKLNKNNGVLLMTPIVY